MLKTTRMKIKQFNAQKTTDRFFTRKKWIGKNIFKIHSFFLAIEEPFDSVDAFDGSLPWAGWSPHERGNEASSGMLWPCHWTTNLNLERPKMLNILEKHEEYVAFLKADLELQCSLSNRFHRAGPNRNLDRAMVADRRVQNLTEILVSMGVLPKTAL